MGNFLSEIVNIVMLTVGIILVSSSYNVYSQLKQDCPSGLVTKLRWAIGFGSFFISSAVGYFVCRMKCGCRPYSSGGKTFLFFNFFMSILLLILNILIKNDADKCDIDMGDYYTIILGISIGQVVLLIIGLVVAYTQKEGATPFVESEVTPSSSLISEEGEILECESAWPGSELYKKCKKAVARQKKEELIKKETIKKRRVVEKQKALDLQQKAQELSEFQATILKINKDLRFTGKEELPYPTTWEDLVKVKALMKGQPMKEVKKLTPTPCPDPYVRDPLTNKCILARVEEHKVEMVSPPKIKRKVEPQEMTKQRCELFDQVLDKKTNKCRDKCKHPFTWDESSRRCEMVQAQEF